MRHIHTSIVSRHLTTRGNNKILCTPPPHISSSEEILLRLTRRTLAQLRTNKSYLHKVDAKSHSSPLYPFVTLIHTPLIMSSTTPTYAPRCTTGFVDRPRRSDGTAGQMDGETDWWTTSGKIGLSYLARVNGVGRQQHYLKQPFVRAWTKILELFHQYSVNVCILVVCISVLLSLSYNSRH